MKRILNKWILTQDELNQINQDHYQAGLKATILPNPVCTTTCRTKSCVAARPRKIKVKIIEDTIK